MIAGYADFFGEAGTSWNTQTALQPPFCCCPVGRSVEPKNITDPGHKTKFDRQFSDFLKIYSSLFSKLYLFQRMRFPVFPQVLLVYSIFSRFSLSFSQIWVFRHFSSFSVLTQVFLFLLASIPPVFSPTFSMFFFILPKAFRAFHQFSR